MDPSDGDWGDGLGEEGLGCVRREEWCVVLGV